MGSDKYASESQYSQYLSGHGGGANAYTKEEETNFYFHVDSSALAGALDIFAQFFIAPLFAPSCVSREMHAIDSEHQLRVQNDDRRRYEILALSSSPQSPLHHYGAGSFDTLNRTDIRDRLLDFHHSHYSANRMRLVVLGKESVEQLQSMVEASFVAVPNRNISLPPYESLPFPPRKAKTRSSAESNESLPSSYTGKVVFIEPVMDSSILTLYWQSPSQRALYRASPSAYLSFLLSHKSEGTLQHQLKSRGWLKFLTASDEVDASSFNLYHVRMGLTDDGLSHVDEIIQCVYEYLHLILTDGITERVSDELIDMERLSFLYRVPTDLAHFVSELASRMQQREVEDLLLSPDRRLFDETAIRTFVSGITAQDVLMLLSSSNFTSDCFRDAEVERYYQIPYITHDLPDEAIQRWTRVLNDGYVRQDDITTNNKTREQYFSFLLPHPSSLLPHTTLDHWPFSLPPPNPFLSHHFELVGSDEAEPDTLHLVRDDNVTRVWWRGDTRFKLPVAYFFLEIRSPLLLSTPTTQAAAQLYAALVTESFMSVGYQATLAGYTWNVEAVPSALRVSVSGYGEHIDTVLQRLFTHLASPTMDERRFETVKALLLSHRDNIFLGMQPYEHALYLAQLITEQHKYADSLITQHATQLTADSIRAFIPRLYADSFFEAFAYGDIKSTAASGHMDYLIALVNSTGSQHVGKHHAAYHVYDVPAGRYLYQWYSPTNSNPNSAVYVSIFTSSYHVVRHSAILSLLHLLIQPFCFEQLRAQQQLGYVVKCINTIHFNTVQSFDVVVQGAEYDASYMDERIETMLMDFHAALSDMAEDAFNTARQSAYLLRSSPPSCMASLATQTWSHVTGLDHHFNRAQEEAAQLSNLTHAEVVAFYRRHIMPDVDRRRVSVEVWAGKGENRRLPVGLASPTAVITEDNREGVKEEWRVWERSQHGGHDGNDGHGNKGARGGKGSKDRRDEYIVDSIFKQPRDEEEEATTKQPYRSRRDYGVIEH